MATKFVNTHPQFTVFVAGSFAPASDGEIEFFEAGTTGAGNRKDTYNTPTLSDPIDPSEINPNPVPLDGFGRSTVPIFLVGTYNTIIRDSAGNQIDNADDVTGFGGNEGTQTVIVDNVTELAAIDTQLFQAAYILGKTAIGDGGQGWFYYSSVSAVSDNGISVIEPDIGNGRWLKQNNSYDSLTSKLAGGTVDAITITTSPVATTLDGTRLFIVENVLGPNAFTGVTVTIDSTTTLDLKRDSATDLKIGDTGLAGYKMLIQIAADLTEAILLNPFIVADNQVIANTIGGTKITDATITGGKLVNATVTQTQMANNSIGYDQMRNSAIHQDELSTSTATSTFAVDFFEGDYQHDSQTDAGGQYSFWFTSEITGISGAANAETLFWFAVGAAENANITGKDTRIALCGADKQTGLGAVSADGATTNRYIDASPPYNLGHGDIPLFIWLRVDKDGKVTGSQTSQAPVWAYNGKTCITPDRHCAILNPKTGRQIGTRKFRTIPNPEREIIVPPWMGGDPNKWDIEKYLNPEMVEIEIDAAFKNSDMNDIPHPFRTLRDGDRVVLIEPTSPIVDSIVKLHVDGQNIGQIFQQGYLELIDKIEGYTAPVGVEVYSARWKNGN